MVMLVAQRIELFSGLRNWHIRPPSNWSQVRLQPQTSQLPHAEILMSFWIGDPSTTVLFWEQVQFQFSPGTRLTPAETRNSLVPPLREGNRHMNLTAHTIRFQPRRK